MSANVAEIIVETLQSAGAKRCYGVVGDTLNHFTDALRQSDIQWVAFATRKSVVLPPVAKPI